MILIRKWPKSVSYLRRYTTTHVSRMQFWTKDTKEEEPQPVNTSRMEYQAPVDDTIDHKRYSKAFRRYFFLIPLALYFTYKIGFIKSNQFSNQKELTFLSKNFEENYVGPYISKFANKQIHGMIYKQDTPEVKRAQQVVDRLIKQNNLYKFWPEVKVKVVHIPNVGVFMSLDRTLYISVKTLKEAQNDDELAMIICHEFSHYLLDHLPLKFKNIFQSWHFEGRWNKNKNQYNKAPSAHRDSFQKVTDINHYIWFNKHSRFFSKYYERKADILSHELCHRAGYDILKGIEIYRSKYLGNQKC